MNENMSSTNDAITDTGYLNPWVSIWTKPRATIRQILDSKSEAYVNIIAMTGGVASALSKAAERNYGDEFGLFSIFTLAIFLGALSGLIGLYIGSALLHWTGKWIGGHGEYDEIKVAMAWSNVPVIWGMLLWIPNLLLFGKEIFCENMTVLENSTILAITAIIIGVISIIIGIWSFIIQLKCLGEAQRFSAWAALGNMLLAGLVVFIPLFFLMLLIAL